MMRHIKRKPSNFLLPSSTIRKIKRQTDVKGGNWALKQMKKPLAHEVPQFLRPNADVTAGVLRNRRLVQKAVSAAMDMQKINDKTARKMIHMVTQLASEYGIISELGIGEATLYKQHKKQMEHVLSEHIGKPKAHLLIKNIEIILSENYLR